MNRWLAGAGIAVILAAAVLYAVLRINAPGPPAEAAVRLVPAEALAYVHLSTDPDRAQDREFLRRLGTFPAVRALRDRLTAGVGRDFDLVRDVRPWLGDEAAIALLDSGDRAANTLVLLRVRDRRRADEFLRRAVGAQGSAPYRGVEIKRFGPVSATFVSGFMAVGQDESVRAAIDRSQNRGPALDTAPGYRRATVGRARARSLDLYLAPDGVRRVLRPAGGFVGALGGLLDHDKLLGVAASAAHHDDGVRMRVRQSRSAGRGVGFRTELLDEVPRAAAGYAGLRGLDAVGRLFAPATAKALRRPLDGALRSAALDLDRDVLRPLRGEVAVSLTPGLPVPTFTLVAKTADERRTREALARLQQPLGELLAPPVEKDAPQPGFEQREVSGTTVFALRITPGVELSYAVAKGLLVVSTQADGVARVLGERASLREAEAFERAVGEVPDTAEAILFLDVGQLLSLAEQAGLTGDPAFQGVRDDLRRLRTAGTLVQADPDHPTDSTAEIFLELP